MTYQITDETDLQSIRDAYNAAVAGTGTWSQAYSAVLWAITDTNTDAAGGASFTPKTGVDPAVWTWVNGAIGVNSSTGGFANYIRGYTGEQYQLRSGIALSDSAIQSASNDIAEAFVRDILYGNGSLPSLDTIAGIDAGGVAAGVFNGSGSSTGAANYSPWAGTVLFAYLGDAQPFNDWVLNLGTSDHKQEPGTYDLISIAEATHDQWTAGFVASVLVSGELPTALTLLQLGGQTVSDLTTATNTFFANTYGLASGTIDIGNDIFGLIGTNTHYIVGTVSDGATLNETGGQDVIHGGAGDDTIVGVGHPTSGSDNVVVSVVDGGGGDNNLDYSSATDNLNVTMDDSGAFDYRLVIDKGPTDDPSATDYAVNIQTLDLGSGDDTFTAPAEFPTGSGTIMIDGGGGTNTLDFSDYSGSITFANGDVSSGPNFNNFQRLIGSARADTFNLEDDGSDAGSSAIQMIDGGNGSDTFNINNNGVSSPLLLEGGNGDDTFYVNNPNSGQYTVIWGGDGADTYDFTTQEVLNPFDVVAVDMEGLNQTTFEHLDVNALEADLDNIYGADPNRIVILNPDSQDQLQFWEMTAGSPQSNVSGFTDYYWGSDHQHVDGYELSANGLQMSPGLAYSDTSIDPTGRVLDLQAEQSYPLTTTVDFGPDGSVVNTTNYLYIDGIHLFGFAQGQFGITLTDGPSDDGPNPGNLIPQDFFNSAYDPPAFQASNYQLT